MRSACRRSAARPGFIGAMTATFSSTRWRSASRSGTRSSSAATRIGNPIVYLLEDRARRHRRPAWPRPPSRPTPRKAPDRPGRRSVRREAPARSLPRADALGRGDRHPGYGGGGADLFGGRDEAKGTSQGSTSTSAACRAARPHDRLRDDALGGQERMLMVLRREGAGGRGHLPRWGSISLSSARPPTTPFRREAERRGQGQTCRSSSSATRRR